MENTTLDIWAIQNYPQEINVALENVTDSPSNTMFTNCLSYLRLGGRIIPVHFDTAFYSEEADKLILLKQDGALTTDKFREILKERNIGYHEICFRERKRRKDKPAKELWFAREISVLDEALRDSKKKGVEACEYYPRVKGKLELRYPTEDEIGVKFFDCQPIQGVVVLEDKLVLHINHGETRNISYKKALQNLFDNDMVVSVKKTQKEFPKEAMAKQYKKEQ